ncbi:UbiA family prenyltransferase [Sphingomonas phyllosphaerae]|uniref:UbiA family prenyltransferase n=1 Tax=Sphingomonas phyllosphaerae TaxID=257003 RepID=UPI0024131E13|nr:UbiA family prenyltransferase [Sphingomonas phyllosphaerae]
MDDGTTLAMAEVRGDAPARSRPLVVDLDHSLVRTDTLHECLVTLAFRYPGRMPAVVGALGQGRAAFKRAAMLHAGLDCEALPLDPAVVAVIARRRASGGEVHLVTAADQLIADGVAAATGLFDSATGSDGTANLKAEAKAEALARRFPGGFDYVGDSLADVPVWRCAETALLAGDRRGVARRLAHERILPELLPRRAVRARDWVKALRLHQWSKNLLVLAPIVLSHEFLAPALLLEALAAFVLFGVVASATYLINDLADLSADRRHPSKRYRALAAGLIPLATAVPLAAGLLGAGLIGGWLLAPAFGATLSCYAVLTLLYSFRLKREPLVDVGAIAALFTLRVVAGMVVIGHPVSLWLATFTATLFLSLALAKRSAELVQAARSGRPVHGRGYLPGDEPLTLALGVAAGIVSVLVMVMYMSVDAMPSGLYVLDGALYVIPAVLCLWVMRVWLLAHRGVLDDDPVIFALRDQVSWWHAGAVAGLWLAAVGGRVA